jgi:hypothetical protein
MKLKVLFFALYLIIILPNCAYAQDPSFSVFAGLALPSGDFGDDGSENDGFAKTGFCAGVDYTKPLPVEGLGWYSSLSVIYNPLDKDKLEELLSDEFDEDLEDMMKSGSWLNIPILTGLKYTFELEQNMNLFLLGQAGLNIAKINKIKFEEDGEDLAEMTFKTKTSIGFGIGAGVSFSNFTITARYLGLGEPEIEPEVEADGESEELDSMDKSISMMTLTLGFSF